MCFPSGGGSKAQAPVVAPQRDDAAVRARTNAEARRRAAAYSQANTDLTLGRPLGPAPVGTVRLLGGTA